MLTSLVHFGGSILGLPTLNKGRDQWVEYALTP